MRARLRSPRFLLAGICGLFLAIILPINLGLGANGEEMVGLLRVAPERLYPPGAPVSPSEDADKNGLRTSDELPVWGVVWAGGSYDPLMIDSHMGAVSWYSARLFAKVGGLTGARLHSSIVGVITLVMIFVLGARIAGDRVGLLAALLAATSTQFAFVFSMVRPDEQFDSVCHLAALLALIRHHDTGRSRWLFAGLLLLGAGVASKNTALWTLAAIAGAGLAFRLIPRVRVRDWCVGGALFLVPLVPQIAYLLFAEDSGAMSTRLNMISAPWESLAPDNLLYSVRHFADAVGHAGTLGGGYLTGDPGRSAPLPGVGFLMFGGVLLCIGGAFSTAANRAVRAFGAGVGLLLLMYITFYYRGESYYLLMAPWIPLALAIVGTGLWNTAVTFSSQTKRRGALAIIGLLGALIATNNVVEMVRYERAVAAPGAAMFDRNAQEAATGRLTASGVDRPYVTTYGGVGVFELLSDDALRPVYLFPYFRAVCRGDRTDFRAAWNSILIRLGRGAHTIVLVPNPSPVDTSPCKHGEWIAEELRPAAAARGAQVTTIETYTTATGLPILEIVEVETR